MTAGLGCFWKLALHRLESPRMRLWIGEDRRHAPQRMVQRTQTESYAVLRLEEGSYDTHGLV
jgi:hypothetical protein